MSQNFQTTAAGGWNRLILGKIFDFQNTSRTRCAACSLAGVQAVAGNLLCGSLLRNIGVAHLFQRKAAENIHIKMRNEHLASPQIYISHQQVLLLLSAVFPFGFLQQTTAKIDL